MCPRRKITRGAAPALVSRIYKETRGLGPNKKEKDKWDPPADPPGLPSQVRALMAVATSRAIQEFMRHHCY